VKMSDVVTLLVLFAVLVTLAFAVLRGSKFKRKLFIAIFTAVGVFLVWLLFIVFVHFESMLMYYLAMYLTMSIFGLILPVTGGKIFRKV